MEGVFVTVEGLDTSSSSASFSVESAFRQTVDQWQDLVIQQQKEQRKRGSQSSSSEHIDPWSVWSDFSSQLSNAFDSVISSTKKSSTSTSSTTTSQRHIQRRTLEIIGGCEEGILFIEKQIYEQQLGVDVDRDAALSKLYTTYGKMLSKLSPTDCFRLALDPHTLLVGAPETIEKFHRQQEDSDETSTDARNDVSTQIQQIFGPLCIDNADNALRNSISLDARNDEASNLLQSLTGKTNEDIHARKGQEFVALLFDEVAESFDKKLLEDLQYKVPTIIGKTIRDHVVLPMTTSSSSTTDDENDQPVPVTFMAALDAGCGTGLAGRQIRDLVNGPIVGVDASSKMLDVAKQCTYKHGCESSTSSSKTQTNPATASGKESNKDDDDYDDHTSNRPLYESLLQMDLEEMTIQNTLIDPTKASSNSKTVMDGFDLIVAADVLVYFGTLERIMQVFLRLASPTRPSYLVFTCERSTEEEAPLGYRLLPTGRFAHTKQHALDTAQNVGYDLFYYDEIVPRMEREEPVQGHLFVFVRTPSQEIHNTDEL